MKFKKGKLYKVVRNDYNSGCIGCVLRYSSLSKNSNHPYTFDRTNLSAVEGCGRNKSCGWNLDFSEEIFVEYEGMVKFCKKLRKERKAK